MSRRSIRITVAAALAVVTVLLTGGSAQADDVYRLRQYETTYAVPR